MYGYNAVHATFTIVYVKNAVVADGAIMMATQVCVV